MTHEIDPDDVRWVRARLELALDELTVEILVREGRAMSLDDAVEYALASID